MKDSGKSERPVSGRIYGITHDSTVWMSQVTVQQWLSSPAVGTSTLTDSAVDEVWENQRNSHFFGYGTWSGTMHGKYNAWSDRSGTQKRSKEAVYDLVVYAFYKQVHAVPSA